MMAGILIVSLLYQAWVFGQLQLAPAFVSLHETCRLLILLFDYPTTEVLAFGSHENQTATKMSYLHTLCDDFKDIFCKSGDKLDKMISFRT